MKTNWKEILRRGPEGESAKDYGLAVLVAGLIYGNPPVDVPLSSDPANLVAALKKALQGGKALIPWAVPEFVLESFVNPHAPPEALAQAWRTAGRGPLRLRITWIRRQNA